MAKHCTNCGHELRDTDKFCAECGTAVGGVLSVSQATRQEACEIVGIWIEDGGWFGQDHCQFVAKAIGPRGTFNAEVSPILKGGILREETPEHKAALDSLIRRLAADGWEPLPTRGKDWYSFKFHRQVKGQAR